MKKMFFMMLTLGVMTIAPSYGQETKRPADIGNAEFDDFKNASFNVQEESGKLKGNLAHIDEEIKSYSGVMSTIGVEKLKENYKALKGVKTEVEKLNTNIGELDEKGKDMVTNASKVTPKMKSIKATANTKKAVSALDVAKSNMSGITTMLQEDMKLVTDELKSRGEPIE